MNNNNKKVLLAMSGGVDSSVAAFLLKEKGYEVTGITMKFCIENAHEALNKSIVNDAKNVCNTLNIKHFVVDFSDALTKNVIANFINEYKNGVTPNPCINCNEKLKFGLLHDKIKEFNCNYFSTGHYANIIEKHGKFFLTKAKDLKKDQTYFLYRIKYENLQSILFPLGNYTKEEVRIIAKQANLPVATKRESQDICFIPDKDTKAFLSKHIKDIKPGNIFDIDGRILGKHKGYIFYTIGQRGGLGISNKKPLYVKNIDPITNSITVCEKEDLTASSLIVENWNSLIDEIESTITGKIRYASIPSLCLIETINEYQKKIVFQTPQTSITKGQSFVAYNNNKVIGGGFIKDILS